MANSIASLASVMLKTLKVANLEERLDKIENSLALEGKSANPVTSDMAMQGHKKGDAPLFFIFALIVRTGKFGVILCHGDQIY